MTSTYTAELEHTLKHRSLHALLILTNRALVKSGFDDVHILDRRTPKQKSRYGGHELMAETTVGSLPAKVVVKIVRDDLRLRHLDEMAGTVNRSCADVGLVVATGKLTKAAKQNLGKYTHARIEAVDGAALAGMLTKYKIGVRPSGEPDYAFFEGLEEYSARVLDFIAREGAI